MVYVLYSPTHSCQSHFILSVQDSRKKVETGDSGASAGSLGSWERIVKTTDNGANVTGIVINMEERGFAVVLEVFIHIR